MNSSTLNTPIDAIRFGSPEEEIAYLRKKLDGTQNEFLEFQESSRELEMEYETQVKQLEKKNNDYMTKLAKLEIENDQLKSKYSAHANETHHKLNEYQEQITGLQALNTRLSSYIRELEQNNDDLERAHRALAASLEDFEAQLNQQIERNVLLENEVTEKEELECIVQRLKEESRDLKHELIAKQSEATKRRQMIDGCVTMNPSSGDSSPSINSHGLDKFDDKENQNDPINPDDKMRADVSISTNDNVTGVKPNMVDSTTSPPQTPSHFPFSTDSISPSSLDASQQTSNPSSPTMPAMVMTPSSRISALNIVSELLRKVLTLESKLSSPKKGTSG